MALLDVPGLPSLRATESGDGIAIPEPVADATAGPATALGPVVVSPAPIAGDGTATRSPP